MTASNPIADAAHPVPRKGSLSHIAVLPVSALVILSLATLVNSIQPAGDERITGVNPLLAAKLLVAASATALGVWGLLQSPRVRRCFSTLPGVLLSMLAVLLVVAGVVATGDFATISRASSLILCGYLGFAITTLVLVDLRGAVRAVLLGSTVFLAITWVLFLFVPSVGIFYEYTQDGATTVPRMGGTNHPNYVAREAMITVLLCIATLRAGRLRESRPLIRSGLYVLLIVSLATMVTTYSRTSMIAGTVAIGAILFDKLWGRYGAILVGVVISLALAGILAAGLFSVDGAGESAVSAITKSGDVEELTSFTGRTTIWAEAIDWIIKKPLTGWGMDSAASVMTKEAVGTHNMLLHITFSGGLLAGLVMIGLLMMTAYHAASSQEPLMRGMCTYVLVSGLVEDTLFESFPSASTLLWIMLLLWPTLQTLASSTQSSDTEQSRPEQA